MGAKMDVSTKPPGYIRGKALARAYAEAFQVVNLEDYSRDLAGYFRSLENSFNESPTGFIPEDSTLAVFAAADTGDGDIYESYFQSTNIMKFVIERSKSHPS